MLEDLGKITSEQKLVAIIFSVTAFCWVFRKMPFIILHRINFNARLRFISMKNVKNKDFLRQLFHGRLSDHYQLIKLSVLDIFSSTLFNLSSFAKPRS